MKNITLISFLVLFCLFTFVGSAVECPKGNIITKMSSTMESFKAVQPLNFSKIQSAGAMANKASTKIQVCLSNANFTINKMVNDFVLPIQSKDQFIVAIKFSNGKEKVVPGTYHPSAGYGKPFWVFAEIKLYKGEKGTIISLGVREGTATITELTASRICGTFDLKTKAGSGTQAAVAGTFNCKLESSRW